MVSDLFAYLDVSPPPLAEGGLLCAKTVSVQPNLSVRGWPTEAGSVALKGFAAVEDATVVERLRQAGAAIKGSTRMSELGFGLVGDTGARALAEGQVDLVLLTDTMGEARVAAVSARAFGFKPSQGIVSRLGLNGLVPSMEALGVLARTPGEIAAVMTAISGIDERDFSMTGEEMPDFRQFPEQEGLRGSVSVIREGLEALGAHGSMAFRQAISAMEGLGLKVREVSLPDFDLFRAVHQVIGAAEASSSAGKYDGVRYGHRTASARNWNEMYLRTRAESFGDLIKAYLFQGAYFQFEEFEAFENACRIRARLVKEVESMQQEADLISLPVRRFGLDGTRASTVSEVYDAFSLTLMANVTGQPSMVIPGLVLDAGEDLGLQLIGRRLSDVRLLSVAHRLSQSARGVK